MSLLFFTKYHGLGNDFIILDDPPEVVLTSSKLRVSLSDRQTGIGCDQILVLNGKDGKKLRIFNGPDGTEAEACGNGTRCVVKHVAETRTIEPEVAIKGPVGEIRGKVLSSSIVRVVQGKANLMKSFPEIQGNATVFLELSKYFFNVTLL